MSSQFLNLFSKTYSTFPHDQQVQNSDLDGICRQIIDSGRDLNEPIFKGRTCLHCAVIAENESVVRLLLSAGASPNVVDDEGDTLLLSAVRTGKIELVQLLVDAGANVDYINPKSSKYRPKSILHDAVDAGHHIMKLLLEQGADPNKANSFGMSVLYKTTKADYNKSSILRLLFKHGADMNNSGLENSTYPLEELISYNRADGVQVFLGHGYDLNNYKTSSRWCPSALHQAVLSSAQNMWGSSSVTDTLSLLIDHYRALGSLNLECVDPHGRSPLFICIPHRIEHLEILLKAGADPNHADEFITPLESAFFSSPTVHPKCIQILLEAGAEPRIVFHRLRSLIASEPEIFPNNEEADDVGQDVPRMNRITDGEKQLFEEKARIAVKYRVLYESKVPVKNPVYEMCDELDNLQAYCESCNVEIALLRSCQFNCSVTYHTMLTDEKFWKRVRSDSPYDDFNVENLDRRFPIYATDLRSRYFKARFRHELWESAAKGLQRLLKMDLVSHHLIFSRILNRLREQDLRNLRLC